MRIVPALVLVFLLASFSFACADEIDDAQALLGGEQHAEGVARMKKAIAALEKKPQDVEAVRRAGVGWFFLEEDAKAQAAFRRAIELAPKNAKAYYWLAILQQYSDLEQAEKTMAQAVELAEEKTIYFFHLAEMRRFQEKTDAALANKIFQELGGRWVLGMTANDGAHATLGPHWKVPPPYPELKEQVILAAKGELEPLSTWKVETE